MKKLCFCLTIFAILPLRSSAAQIPSAWWTWVYLLDTNQLVLVNESGEVERIQRPLLPNEDSSAFPFVSVSPDGKTLIVAERLTKGNMGLGFYSLELGIWLQVHETQPNEEVVRIGQAAYSPDGSQVALGFATPAQNAWRVIVFDTDTGDWLARIFQDDALLEGFTADLPMRPVVKFFDTDRVHVQLVTGEVAEQYPAFAWNPTTHGVQTSPYTYATMDVAWKTGNAAYLWVDSTQPTPSALSDFFPYNAIGTDLESRRAVWHDSEHLMAEVRLVENTILIQQPASGWSALIDDSLVPFDRTIRDVVGVSGGFLSLSETTLAFHGHPTQSTPLWDVPETNAVLLWVSPADFQTYPMPIRPAPDAIVVDTWWPVGAKPGPGAQNVAFVPPLYSLKIIGRLENNTWLHVTSWENFEGWIERNAVFLTIDLSTVPIEAVDVVTTPSLPPPSPTNTTAIFETAQAPIYVPPPVASQVPSLAHPTPSSSNVAYFFLDSPPYTFGDYTYSLAPCECRQLRWSVLNTSVVYLVRQHFETREVFGPLSTEGSHTVCAAEGLQSFTLYAGGPPDSVVGTTLDVYGGGPSIYQQAPQCVNYTPQAP